MPERARVFIAEDSVFWDEAIKDELEYSGHIVIASAATLDEALKIVEKFRELEVQVAIIDGNLTQSDSSGADGCELVDAI